MATASARRTRRGMYEHLHVDASQFVFNAVARTTSLHAPPVCSRQATKWRRAARFRPSSDATGRKRPRASVPCASRARPHPWWDGVGLPKLDGRRLLYFLATFWAKNWRRAVK